MQRRSGMAKNTSFEDWPSEIGILLVFVAWRQVVGLAAAVVGHGGLEQVPAQIHEIAAGMFAGTDYEINAVLSFIAPIFPSLPITHWRGVHRDL